MFGQVRQVSSLDHQGYEGTLVLFYDASPNQDFKSPNTSFIGLVITLLTRSLEHGAQISGLMITRYIPAQVSRNNYN